MPDLLDLANDARKLAAAIPSAASEAAKQAAIDIVTTLVNRTPVDTSQALSNWITQLDMPYDGTIGPYYRGFLGTTQASSAREAIVQATQAVKNKAPGQIIWISNNLPYIERLNQGYSKQAPAGFVEASLLIVTLKPPQLNIRV